MSRVFTCHAPLMSALPAKEGVLGGLRFSVKDIFDVAGYQTGFGSPTWMEKHPDTATKDAEAVRLLNENGATFVGKTIMCELAWSLTGENEHYGTPPNPAAPGCVPGGSSSGAAVSVADGSCDIALGTDTGGSVRIPSSHCGLWGLRPTHGRISLEGACSLAHSFDTTGVFAKNAEHLRLATSVLLQGKGQAAAQPRWLVATNSLDVLESTAREVVDSFLSGLDVPLEKVHTGDVEEQIQLLKVIQASEVWGEYGKWVTEEKPVFGKIVNERFKFAEKSNAEEVERATGRRGEIKAMAQALLGDDGLLLLPAAPSFPPKCGGEADAAWRDQVLRLTSLAGLAGLPQVVFPLNSEKGALGMSAIGPEGSDEWLMQSVQSLLK